MARSDFCLDQGIPNRPGMDARAIGRSRGLRSQVHQHAGAGTKKSFYPGPCKSLPSIRRSTVGVSRRSRATFGAIEQRSVVNVPRGVNTHRLLQSAPSTRQRHCRTIKTAGGFRPDQNQGKLFENSPNEPSRPTARRAEAVAKRPRVPGVWILDRAQGHWTTGSDYRPHHLPEVRLVRTDRDRNH